MTSIKKNMGNLDRTIPLKGIKEERDSLLKMILFLHLHLKARRNRHMNIFDLLMKDRKI
jgi:hypothetical protein